MQAEDLCKQEALSNRGKACTWTAVCNLLLDERCEWQIIEEVCELLPHIGVAVLPQALVVESVSEGPRNEDTPRTNDSAGLLTLA